MNYLIKISVWATLLMGMTLSCQREAEHGYLSIYAPEDGKYEIYKMMGLESDRLVSEVVGVFNKSMPLSPGTYLIILDCSSAWVRIEPKKETTYIAHTLKFTKPSDLDESPSSFAIQCDQASALAKNQVIRDRFSINVLSQNIELLAGVKPLRIKLGDEIHKVNPKVLHFPLVKFRVEQGEVAFQYFVSSKSQLTPLTLPQNSGAWVYLLPGTYSVELNGSQSRYQFSAGDVKSIAPGYLYAKSPPHIDLDLIERYSGEPAKVVSTQGSRYGLNELIPLLQGDFSVYIGKSDISEKVTIQAEQITRLELNAVTIEQVCPPENPECKGKVEVFVFDKDEAYPFIKSNSDIPLLYNKEKEVSVSLEPDGALSYKIKGTNRAHSIGIGKVLITPVPQYRPGYSTDFLRIEALDEQIAGYSHDLNLRKEDESLLVEGSYAVATYNTIKPAGAVEPIHKRNEKRFRIEKGNEITLEIPIYLSQKQFLAFKKEKTSLNNKGDKKLN